MEAAGPECQECGRAIHEGRASRLYCGWSPASEFDESAPKGIGAACIASGPRTFRPGATTGSLLLWSLIASVAAVILFKNALERLYSTEDSRRLLLLSAAALVVVGPLAFVAHLLRMALVSVTILPGEGLLLSGRRRIGWSEIDRVEYHGARYISDFVLVRLLLDLIRSISGLVTGGLHGPVRLMLLLLMVGVSLLIPPAAFVSGVLFPVFFLLSPWQPRIVLLLKGGERLAWRDLRHEADFVALVERGIRSAGVAGDGPIE